jgi:hypothetical protein
MPKNGVLRTIILKLRITYKVTKYRHFSDNLVAKLRMNCILEIGKYSNVIILISKYRKYDLTSD